MKTNKRYPFFIALAIIMACLALFFAVKFVDALIDRFKPPKTPYEQYLEQAQTREWSKTITYKGQKMHTKRDLTTLLLLGIDNVQVTDPKGNIGTGGRSDAIMLLLLDDTKKTISSFSISRDTQTTVEAYNHSGEFLYAGNMHLALQYAFADSAQRGCYLAKKAISNLLHGMYIGGTMSMTMDAIPTVVDAMGGLKLTFDQDFSDIDPAYKKGATVVLNGTQAESFVRYRDKEVTGSAEQRVNRMEWLAGEMFKNLSNLGGSTFVDEVLDKAKNYIYSDINVDDLKKLSSYKYTEAYTLPGESKGGGINDVFIYDENALQELIVQLFYEPVQ